MASQLAVRAGPGHPVWDALNERGTREELAALIRARLSKRSVPAARREADAEAILSDVCERALRRQDSYDHSKAAPIAWLVGIALTVLRERAPRSMVQLDAPVDAFAPETSILERLAAAELLSRIPADDRQILAWHFEGWTGPEIAERLGITPGAARARLHRARTFARELLSPEIGENHHA